MAKIAFEMIPLNPDIQDTILAFGSGGIFIHCEIVFENGMVGYCSNKGRGVVLLNIADRDYNSGNWMIFDVPCSYSQEQTMLNYFVQRQGFRYNSIGVGAMLLGISINRSKSQFCSESCLGALIDAGVVDTSFPPNLVSPNFLYQIIEKLNWKQIWII